MTEGTGEKLPEDMLQRLYTFDQSVTGVEEALKKYLKIPASDWMEKINDPLEKAKLELMIAYTVNSMFWSYLITQGIFKFYS